MILSLSMILAVVIGFSIQRASICMVKAVAEIFTTHRALMLISFAKTILWIELVMVPLIPCPANSDSRGDSQLYCGLILSLHRMEIRDGDSSFVARGF